MVTLHKYIEILSLKKLKQTADEINDFHDYFYHYLYHFLVYFTVGLSC